MTNIRRLPLENAYNVRELGGFVGKNNQVTNFRRFLRGDDVSGLSEKDINYLLDYNITAVIDLRSSYETEYAPSVLAKISQLNYMHISLLPFDIGEFESTENMTKMFTTFGDDILTKIYIDILTEETDNLRQTFEFIAEQSGGVLFHCAAGKDRTGVLAMLLLGLAGVQREDIIADYMVTEVYNTANPNQRVVNLPIELSEGLLASNPKSIAAAYDFLISAYGSFEKYFQSLGLDETTIQVLKKKLLGDS